MLEYTDYFIMHIVSLIHYKYELAMHFSTLYKELANLNNFIHQKSGRNSKQ